MSHCNFSSGKIKGIENRGDLTESEYKKLQGKDMEIIAVDLDEIPSNVKEVFVAVNCFSGGITFDQI